MRVNRTPARPGPVGGVVALVVALSLGGLAGLGSTRAHGTDGSTASARPNIVVIMTDDQTVESLRVMPRVRRLFGNQGTTFDQNVVSFPLCCPSRATYLTGQYATNNGVRGNLPPFGGYGVFTGQDTTFPAALQASGYDTVHIGKYLNGFGVGPDVSVPPGWSQFYGGIDPSTYRYFGFTLLENGRRKTYPKRDAEYETDVFTRLAVSTIRHRSHRHEPFFMNVAYLAPHVQATEGTEGKGRALPAPRHAEAFADEPLPRSPSFDEGDVSDKPDWVQALPRLSKRVRAEMTVAYRASLASLLAVDEGVERIVAALRRTGQLRNTVLVFTSDNGYFSGQHRIAAGKDRFYEPAIRVPLLIRGPGVPRHASQRSLVANIDLAPTILDLADAAPLRLMDGRSLVPMLEGRPAPPDRAVLLQNGGVFRPNFGIRTARYTYFENSSGERELYDLRHDPDQLRNLADDPALAPVRAELSRRLAGLETCAGPTCN